MPTQNSEFLSKLRKEGNAKYVCFVLFIFRPEGSEAAKLLCLNEWVVGQVYPRCVLELFLADSLYRLLLPFSRTSD